MEGLFSDKEADVSQNFQDSGLGDSRLDDTSRSNTGPDFDISRVDNEPGISEDKLSVKGGCTMESLFSFLSQMNNGIKDMRADLNEKIESNMNSVRQSIESVREEMEIGQSRMKADLNKAVESIGNALGALEKKVDVRFESERKIVEAQYNTLKAEVDTNRVEVGEKLEAVESRCMNRVDNCEAALSVVRTGLEEKINAEQDKNRIKFSELDRKYEDQGKQIDRLYIEGRNVAPNRERGWTAISLPKYGEEHPMDFLYKLEKYINKNYIMEDDKLDVVSEAMKGDDREAFEAVRVRLGSFDEFKVWFKNSFWSQRQQNQLRKQIYANNTYREGTRSTMRAHFIKWYGKGKHLEPPIAEGCLISLIFGHFAREWQVALSGQNVQTYEDALEALDRLDMVNNNQGSGNVAPPNRHSDGNEFDRGNNRYRNMERGVNRPDNFRRENDYRNDRNNNYNRSNWQDHRNHNDNDRRGSNNASAFNRGRDNNRDGNFDRPRERRNERVFESTRVEDAGVNVRENRPSTSNNVSTTGNFPASH